MKSFFRVWISIAVIAILLGLGLLIIAVAGGASWKDFSSWNNISSWNDEYITSMNGSVTKANSIDIDIKYGVVTITEGDSFNINAENVYEDEIKSQLKNGTWIIEQASKNNKSFWGINFDGNRSVNVGRNRSPKIAITIPKDFVAKEFNINLGAGEIEAENIVADKGDFRVAAGKLTIDKLIIDQPAKIKIGAGELILKQVNLNNITLNSGAGNVLLEGTVLGNNTIDCGVGSVKLNLVGNKDEYSYDVDCAVGEALINGISYKGFISKNDKNVKADNSFKIKCGAGKITLNINE